MGNPYLTTRFAIFLSLSTLTATALPSSPPHIFLKSKPSRAPSSPTAKATPSDILYLLGSSTESTSKINPTLARQLASCFKFLVPFKRLEPKGDCFIKSRRLLASTPVSRTAFGGIKGNNDESAENELIWWPPEPVLELARLAFDSGGDPDAIYWSLDPAILPVPDVEGSKGDKCELTRTPYGRRFISEEVNSYLAFLFELIAARGSSIGLNVSLNRYDLFHGHAFIATETGRLGILFHAREYPKYDKEVFPYNMGYCQKGSNVTYDESMNLRNILWLAPLPSNSSKDWVAPGVLVVLDTRPGGIIYRDIVPEYVNYARTIYEDDFGNNVFDVNYLNVGNSVPNHQIFIC